VDWISVGQDRWSDGILWTRLRNFGFHAAWWVYWLDEPQWASEEGLWPTEL